MVKFPYLKRIGAKMAQITKQRTLTDSLSIRVYLFQYPQKEKYPNLFCGIWI